MGWTVLYIAFGAVALWLLGEVLLQYKARLRWRLLAFFGFGTVVVGVVLLSSVVVIGLGAVAFAVGQTLVTLSYRKGFVAGWALDGLPGLPDLPGLSRRRDGDEEEYEHAGAAPEFAGDAEPSLEVSDLQEQHPYGQPDVEPPAYAPQPLPEETGEYGVYGREQNVFTGQPDHQDQYGYPEPQPGYQEQQAGYGQQAYAAYSDPYIGYGDGGQQQAAAAYDAGYGDVSHAGYGGYDAGYGGYAAQPDDPYAAAAAGYPAPGYDQAGYDQQAGYVQAGYPQGGYDDGSGYGGYGEVNYAGYGGGYPAGGQDPYAAQPGYDGMPQQATPAEGVWVPQPREGEDPYQPQSAQGYYPYQDGYDYYTDQRGGY